MRKILIAAILFTSINFCAIAQSDIIGIWQAKTSEIASAWLDTYQFFQDGRFIFSVNQYDELSRIVAIKGYYRIIRDSLFFKVESIVENQGGYVSRNTLTSVHNSWSLTGNYKTLEIRQEETEEDRASVRIYINGKIECLEIDGEEFYRIYKDPNKF